MQKLKQNLNKTFILILFLTSSFFVNAQQASAVKPGIAFTETPRTFSAGIRDTDSSSLKCKVWFLNPQEEKVSISIRSENGYLYSRRLRDNWYAQVYNLSDLDDGMYTISVTSGNKSFEKRIKITSDTYVVRRKYIY